MKNYLEKIKQVLFWKPQKKTFICEKKLFNLFYSYSIILMNFKLGCFSGQMLFSCDIYYDIKHNLNYNFCLYCFGVFFANLSVPSIFDWPRSLFLPLLIGLVHWSFCCWLARVTIPSIVDWPGSLLLPSWVGPGHCYIFSMYIGDYKLVWLEVGTKTGSNGFLSWPGPVPVSLSFSW